MDTFRCICGNCSSKIDVPIAYMGRQVKCGNCRLNFIATQNSKVLSEEDLLSKNQSIEKPDLDIKDSGELFFREPCACPQCGYTWQLILLDGSVVRCPTCGISSTLSVKRTARGKAHVRKGRERAERQKREKSWDQFWFCIFCVVLFVVILAIGMCFESL